MKEIRVPKTFASIAGFTRPLAQDRQHHERLRRRPSSTELHPSLRFDARWDKRLGLPAPRRCSSTPILFDKYLLGVLQLINKRGDGTLFTPQDEEAAEELAQDPRASPSTTSTARRARTSPPSSALLVDKGLISEKDIETAITNARVNQLDVAKILMEDFQVPKEEIGRALAQFYNCAVLAARRRRRSSPRTSSARVTADFLKKNMCAPIEQQRGHAARRRRGPLRPHAARRHQGHEPRARATSSWWACATTSSPTSTRATASRRRRRRGGRPRPHHHGARRRARRTRSRRTRSPTRPRSTRPTRGIVKLANQIIIDAYNKGASDIHVEPYGKTAPTIVRFRIDGDCEKYLEVPPAAPQRPRPAPQDHGQARHLREAQAPGRQDPLQGPDGHHRAARRHHPDRRAATRTWSCASSPPRSRCPLEKMGFSERNLARVQGDPRRSPTASASWSARPARARPPRCTPASASSTPRT